MSGPDRRGRADGSAAPVGGARRASARRTRRLLGVMVVAFAAIAVKLTVIQGVDAHRYSAFGASEWTQSVALPAMRGAILDRNGDELALSVPRTTIYADPHQVSDPRAEAVALSRPLGVPVATLQHELSTNSGFVYLAHAVGSSTAGAVAKLNLAGVGSYPDSKRYYPAGQLAAPLIGVVGTDGNGLSGLEYKYNSLLKGTPGKRVQVVDAAGQVIPNGIRSYQAPVPGDDLVLSIDEPLQYDAEQALAKAIVAAKAKSGIALLMDTKTGEILADAQLTMPGAGNQQPPAVPVPASATLAQASSPSTSGPQPVEASSATSFTQVYEPGSVNKLITVSGALQAGVIVPSDVFTIPNAYMVAGTPIHDAETHPVPQHWDVTDIVANSSNIGATQIAQRLGKAGMLHYAHAFGEGSLTDIDFPGESAGLMPRYWSGTTLATMSFGQGIGVTAVQMIAAFNTIANGGVYVPPRLVDGYIGPDGHEHPLSAPPGHRVVSAQVAREMTAMLDQVVQVGTGQAASLEPYTVAGKTGTAQIASPHGGYVLGRFVASFAGFVPSEQPAITAMVVVDNTPDYGAAASAPTFATIARDALELLRIPPHQKVAPPAGVPLTTSQIATAAGDSAGTPLPGLSIPVHVVGSSGAATAGSGSAGGGSAGSTRSAGGGAASAGRG